MLLKIPELDFQDKELKDKGQVSEKQRLKITWEVSRTGSFLLMFYFNLNKTIEKALNGSKNMDDFSKILDKNHGCLPSELEDELQQRLKALMFNKDTKV